MTKNQQTVRSRLLQRLPEEAFELIADELEPIELPARRSLVSPSKPIKAVCFIESGLASMVAETDDGKSFEIRHIGFEGMAGYPVILGVDRTPTKTFMQSSGHGIVTIRDRGKLLEIAGSSYGVPEKEYERLIGSKQRKGLSHVVRVADSIVQTHETLAGENIELEPELG